LDTTLPRPVARAAKRRSRIRNWTLATNRKFAILNWNPKCLVKSSTIYSLTATTDKQAIESAECRTRAHARPTRDFAKIDFVDERGRRAASIRIARFIKERRVRHAAAIVDDRARPPSPAW